MSAEGTGTQRLVLHLASLEELLVAPDPRPLEGRFEDRSGIDRLMEGLRAVYTRRLAGIHAKLILDEPPSPETRQQVDAALKALALHQDARLGEQLVSVRREGLRTLGKGLLFVLACVVASVAVERMTFLPELLRTLVSGGIVIAGWVALWHPMELLLYERWPIQRDRRLYRMIAEMETTIEVRDATGADVREAASRT
jgi:hypothetical protein